MAMKDYFDELNSKLERAYGVARSARAKNFDPEGEPEILPAKDIAARVEGIVGPIGIAEGIRKLGLDRAREEMASDIVKEILEGKYADAKGAKDEDKLIDQAVRTGVAILTEGVLVAPTEGIAGIKRKKNPDGSEYLSVYFAGPIRSAGGTVAALSVVLADFARRHFGLAEYRPTETEVERYVEEINLYDVRAARLQYKPSDDEIRLIVKNCPVCIDGDPTEEFEVSVYKDLERIETNRIRGGMCLVVGEGIAQKASKVLKYTRKRGLDWSWLENLAKVTKGEGKTEIKPNPRFLEEIVAGRPVFAYPSEKGGFRLRYGRTRATGIAAKAIHPATMIILDSFPAIGTQLKLERPGKGCVVTPCDSIEGPIVELGDGSLVQVSTVEEAERVKNDVRRIVFLGDILVSYGDFLKSNHPLMPGGYCEEFWLRELERAAEEKKLDIKKLDLKNINALGAEEAFKISETYGVPLHPKYTYFWHDITHAQLKELAEWLATGKLVYEWFKLREFRVQSSPTKEILEMIGVPHKVNESFLVLDENHSLALLRSLGLLQGRGVSLEKFSKVLGSAKEGAKTLDIVNELAGVKIRERAPTYIGGRMGRPEKAREREMKPSPNVLFPVGEAGGKLRSIMKAYGIAKDRERYEGAGIMVEVARLRCPSCGDITILNRCARCGVKTLPEYVCSRCGKTSRDAKNGMCSCGSSATPYDSRSINLSTIMSDALKRCGNSFSGDIKGVKGMTSECKIPEPLEKGILRAKHDVYVFKDGTCRFDATDVPLTHFYPNEIGVSIEKLKELDYTHDYEGKELTSENQLLELKPQDVLLADRGADYLSRVARFVDDLLVYLYGLPPFYNVKEREDLLGQLVITLSPHTSCGVCGRIIGFTKARVGYTHPYMISARRRNCDGDEDSTMLLMDALINFSKKFLPAARGGTMDASLVLTITINPKEVDDEVHAMEVCGSYPLEFYEATMNFASPSEVKIEKISERLGKDEQYSNIRFTHHTSSIQNAPVKTRYVELKTMKEKVDAQFELCSKIRAVDVRDAAERLILSHFIPDLYGNMRSFSRQSFRCIKCNRKYRRVPLIGKCPACGDKLVLTINKGGIEKYLKISNEIVEKYDLPVYLKQRLALLEKEIASVFEDETSKQFSLEQFM